AGRVQSPTLYALYRREVEINLHLPDPFWTLRCEVEINGLRYQADYKIREFFSKKYAEEVAERCQGKRGCVKEVLIKTKRIPPPPPFNLGDLQREAYRIFGYPPSRTQRIAEKLYLSAVISYPRTASQKLPQSLGLRRIVERLGSVDRYRDIARRILEKGKRKPREGRLTDPAHPAIYPTGTTPAKISSEESKIYDLIVKRFFAAFGDEAVFEEKEGVVVVNQDIFNVRVRKVLEPGWTEYYKPYIWLGNKGAGKFEPHDEAIITRIKVEDKFTPPPERYNVSKLIAYMERYGLGTKSTRAEIIDNLYRRGYIEGREIKVTELGFSVVGILKRFFPELISVKMTSALEEDMSEIESGRKDQTEVLMKAIDSIKPVFERIIERYEDIGEGLLDVIEQMKRDYLGACPKCKRGFLKVIRSRKTGKRFIGCDGYPNLCNFSCPLPQRGKITKSRVDCKICGYPVVEVRDGWKRWRFCINEECPSKKE
ncbi:MAG: DNA topoisomerase, partial [Candidatus Methanomethylicaceae archaeon]